MILQHSLTDFKPPRETQKIDWQHLAMRRANAALAQLQSETDALLIEMARRQYLRWLRDWHINGERGGLI